MKDLELKLMDLHVSETLVVWGTGTPKDKDEVVVYYESIK